MAIELEDDGGMQGSNAQTLARVNVTKKIKLRDRSAFFERLALMLDAGTSLYSALESMERSGDPNTPIHAVVSRLKNDINNGIPFSEALGKYPNLISGVQLKLIAAAEQGSFLPEVINKIVDFDNRQQRLKSALFGALTYPAVLLVVSILVCTFVLLVVFPQFKEMFSSMSDQLPTVSRWMFNLSTQLTENGTIIMPLFIAGLVLLFRWATSSHGKTALKLLVLRIPFIRNMYLSYGISQMARVLALSLEHGVSISDALQHLAGSFGNSQVGETLTDVADRVESGQGLSIGFANSKHMPDMVKQLVSAGEESSSLSRVFTKLANHYENEIDRQVSTLGKIAEPVMLLVMGMMIGGLVSALILPIFKLSTTVN